MTETFTIPHPGKILMEEYLEPLGLTQYRFARLIKVDARRVNAIIKGSRAISADTALRFGHFFGNSAQFWLNLQSGYELALERQKASINLDEIPTVADLQAAGNEIAPSA